MTGLDIVHLHRSNRDGFKGRALGEGLKQAKGDEYVEDKQRKHKTVGAGLAPPQGGAASGAPTSTIIEWSLRGSDATEAISL